MFKRISLIVVAVVGLAAVATGCSPSSETSSASSVKISENGYEAVGRSATPEEVAAWDIDVRPDFAGLPEGAGSVEEGEELWEAKCTSCHGTFGESNEVFTPIVGGTTEEDVKSGRVAALVGNDQPQKTTIMKVATISTLWDYIHRAMPWTEPKSLSSDEVYAVTAYILNLAEIIPDDFTLSNENIAEVQALMPNRNGMTTDHGLHKVSSKPDVASEPCMENCKTTGEITSTYPESARDTHGNIQNQNRTYGAVRGIDSTKPPAKTLEESVALQQSVTSSSDPEAGGDEMGMESLAKKSNCLTCHGVKNKVVGPGFNEVAAKYQSDENAKEALMKKIKNGTSGAWGEIPMPAQTQIDDADLEALVDWILKGN